MTLVASASRKSARKVSVQAAPAAERQGNTHGGAEGAATSWKGRLLLACRVAAMRSGVIGTRWSLNNGSATIAETQAFADLDRVFRIDGIEASGGRFCRVVKACIGGGVYYVKCYRPWGDHFWKSFGRSWSISEYRNLAYFESLGIPVPRTVAYGSRRVGGLFRRGAIVTEAVPGAIDMATLARTRPDLLQDRTWRSQVLTLLADYVGRIHRDGFTYEDLKWRNLLVTTGPVPQVFFIDCPKGGHKRGFRHRYGVIKDLATLDRRAAEHVSRTTRLRFYLQYCGRTRLSGEDKRLIARVLAYRQRKASASSSSSRM